MWVLELMNFHRYMYAASIKAFSNSVKVDLKKFGDLQSLEHVYQVTETYAP